MNEELKIAVTVSVTVFSVVFALKCIKTETATTIAETAMIPLLYVSKLVSYLAHIGLAVVGIMSVFGIGLMIFTYAGGSVKLPSTLNFEESLQGTVTMEHGDVLWEKVPSSVARWKPQIEEASRKCAVPKSIIVSMMQQESGGEPNVCSGAGACGLMQLMPATAREMNVSDVFDPSQNTIGGACYFGKQLKRYQGNVDLALAAYNAGTGAVDQYGGIPPYEETQRYVRSINSLRQKYLFTDSDQRATQTTKAATCCIWPTTQGSISQFSKPKHVALDIAIPTGTNIYAAHDGVVIVSSIHHSYGEYVMIENTRTGFKTLYAHLQTRLVSVGDELTQGKILGYSGNTGNSTGPHLHFEIYNEGQIVDPLTYLPPKE